MFTVKIKKTGRSRKKNAEESKEIEQIMSDFCLGARHCAHKFGGISIENRKGVYSCNDIYHTENQQKEKRN